jgi:hypothetical protein
MHKCSRRFPEFQIFSCFKAKTDNYKSNQKTLKKRKPRSDVLSLPKQHEGQRGTQSVVNQHYKLSELKVLVPHWQAHRQAVRQAHCNTQCGTQCITLWKK